MTLETRKYKLGDRTSRSRSYTQQANYFAGIIKLNLQLIILLEYVVLFALLVSFSIKERRGTINFFGFKTFHCAKCEMAQLWKVKTDR